MNKKNKMITMRSIIAAVYLILLAVMFYTGRTHTILIDNRDTDGISALRSMTVTVGKDEPVDFRKGERDKTTLKGQKLHISVAPMGSSEQSFVIPVPLAYDTVLLSVPKLLAGVTPYLTPFDITEQNMANSRQQAAAEEEEPVVTTGF